MFVVDIGGPCFIVDTGTLCQLNDLPLMTPASPNNFFWHDRLQRQDLCVFTNLLDILHFQLCHHLLFPHLHVVPGTLTDLSSPVLGSK